MLIAIVVLIILSAPPQINPLSVGNLFGTLGFVVLGCLLPPHQPVSKLPVQFWALGSNKSAVVEVWGAVFTTWPDAVLQ